MVLLSIESSALVASVALVDEDKVIAEYTVNFKKTHSQTLMPMVDEICKMCEMDLKTLSGVAISRGPGSFTGLRIGSSSAKGIAYALNIPIVEVPTLEAMAYNLWGSEKLIVPIMDARRDQVYAGAYSFDSDGLPSSVLSERAVSIDELIMDLKKIGRAAIFLGDGVPRFRNAIDEKLDLDHAYAPQNNSAQRAASVGSLGILYLKRGISVSAFSHKPVYLRKSQAERMREDA